MNSLLSEYLLFEITLSEWFSSEWLSFEKKLAVPRLMLVCLLAEDALNVIKPELMVMGRDGRQVQRARRRFSVRENNKQIRS